MVGDWAWLLSLYLKLRFSSTVGWTPECLVHAGPQRGRGGALGTWRRGGAGSGFRRTLTRWCWCGGGRAKVQRGRGLSYGCPVEALQGAQHSTFRQALQDKEGLAVLGGRTASVGLLGIFWQHRAVRLFPGSQGLKGRTESSRPSSQLDLGGKGEPQNYSKASACPRCRASAGRAMVGCTLAPVSSERLHLGTHCGCRLFVPLIVGPAGLYFDSLFSGLCLWGRMRKRFCSRPSFGTQGRLGGGEL